MLFMKGLPSAPQCGFSRQIVEILDNTSVPYDSFNIFEDEEVRQGLKDYSDWPTYPQLYVKGELIGGLDIVRELLDAGELDETLSEAFGEWVSETQTNGRYEVETSLASGSWEQKSNPVQHSVKAVFLCTTSILDSIVCQQW